MPHNSGSSTPVYIDCVDDDRDSVPWENSIVPRIGESVGAWHPEGMEDTDTYVLLFVVDVRHYPGEVRVLVSGRR